MCHGRAAAEESYSRKEDVIYGRKFGTALTMDVFTPAQNANGAAIVLCISGGWVSSHDNIQPLFVWLAQAGAEYDNNKIVYLTPQYYGFDFGVQYAPSMGSVEQMGALSTPCAQAGPACINVSSGNDATRWLNQVAFADAETLHDPVVRGIHHL